MEDQDIEQRFRLVQKQIEATASLMKQLQIDANAAIDSLRIEVEALKLCMERCLPGFSEVYPKLKEEVVQTIDPEWIGSERATKVG